MTPGQATTNTLKRVKSAFTEIVTGTKAEYQQRLVLLEKRTADEMKKIPLHNRLVCVGIRAKIGRAVAMLGDAVKPGDERLKEIDGMFLHHQFVLTINFNPSQVQVNQEAWDFALAQMPTEVDKDRLRMAFEWYVKSSEEQAESAESAGRSVPLKKRQQLLFHGKGGTGKSYVAEGMAFKIFDGGKYSVELNPSLNELFPASAEDTKATRKGPTFPQKSDWIKSPLELYRKVAFLIATGKKIFWADESEKLVLPESITLSSELKVTTPVPSTVKFNFDPARRILFFKLDEFEVAFPWDHVMFIMTTNANFRQIFAPEEADTLIRRFQVEVHYNAPSAESLSSAFRQGMESSLSLERNEKKQDAIRTFFAENGIEKNIIDGAHDDHRIPEHIHSVTAVVVSSMLNRLKKTRFDPAKLPVDIDKVELMLSISHHWRNIYERFSTTVRKPGESPGNGQPGPSRARPPGAPGPSISPQPRPSGPPQPRPQGMPPGPGFNGMPVMSQLKRDDPRSTFDVCYDFLVDAGRPYNAVIQSRVLAFFQEDETLAKIVEKFKRRHAEEDYSSDYSSDSDSAEEAARAAGFFDRKILHKAVIAAYHHTVQSIDAGDAVISSADEVISTVFSDAKDLMYKRQLQRTVCNEAINQCHETFAPNFETSQQIRSAFIKTNAVAHITGWFSRYKFAHPELLRAVTAAAYVYFYEGTSRQDFDASRVEKEIIRKKIDQARKENGEQIQNDRFRPARRLSRGELATVNPLAADPSSGDKEPAIP